MKALIIVFGLTATLLAEFVSAPDLDKPRTLRKTCIYCLDCTPQVKKGVMWVVGDYSRFICQRTEKEMEVDSVRNEYDKIAWGKFLVSYRVPLWEKGDSFSVVRFDTTWRMSSEGWGYEDSLVVDTSGVKRID